MQCSVLIREWGLSMQEQELKEVVAKLRETDTATIEVKSTQGGLPRDLAASIVAFANTRGGTVILGLDENSGFSAHQKFPAQRIRDAFDNMCSQTIVPAIRPTFLDIIPFEESSVVV
ncbi:MAG: ATP-binding protein, partial [Corynebacterium kroppenstedtii]|nr:ATP-binding protein [Corynebacterium kroppenstedtii]